MWGNDSGGDSSAVANEISSNVISVTSSQESIRCIEGDGSCVVWGDGSYGGSVPSAEASLLESG